MLEFAKFYVSDFWVWLGITIGVGLLFDGVRYLLKGTIKAFRQIKKEPVD